MPLRVALLLALVALAAGPRRAGSRPPRAFGSSAGPAASRGWLTLLGRGSSQGSSLLARRLAQAAASSGAGSGAVGSAVADGGIEAAAAVSAAPAPEAEADRVSQCFQLHSIFGGACQVGIDRVAATVFPRGSTEDITAEQEEAAVQALRQGGLRSRGCCATVAPIVAARCGCNRAYVEAREQLQFTYPGLTAPYLRGVNLVFALACDLPLDRACL